jgi:hypothetical protein
MNVHHHRQGALDLDQVSKHGPVRLLAAVKGFIDTATSNALSLRRISG